jgi:hypothetical protein
MPNLQTRPRKIDKIEKESRLITVEELLVSGLGTARVERELARKFDVTTRQVRKYITRFGAAGKTSHRTMPPSVARSSIAWPSACMPRRSPPIVSAPPTARS